MLSNNIESARAEGRRLGLTASQVQSSNFGPHTIYALNRDITKETAHIMPHSFEENRTMTTIRPTPERVRKMFQRYQALDPQQIEGILKFGMTRLEVTSPSYRERYKIYNLPIRGQYLNTYLDVL